MADIPAEQKERTLRQEWLRCALGRAKVKKYEPSRRMQEIDALLTEMDANPMMDMASRKKELWFDITAFDGTTRQRIVEGLMFDTPAIKIVPGNSDNDFLKLATSRPDGSGLGETLWMTVIPHLELYLTSGGRGNAI